MAMTDKEYVDNGGKFCPFCNSNNIESKGPMEADGTAAWSYTQCDDCGSEWDDLYTMTGFNTITNNVPDNSEQLLNEVIDDAFDTCLNDSGYMKSLLREHFSSMSHDEIRKLHHDAFGDNDE